MDGFQNDEYNDFLEECFDHALLQERGDATASWKRVAYALYYSAKMKGL